MEFCQDALCIVKQLLVNASSLKERVAALFLLYAVYYKKPVDNLKIRMTLSDWKYLMELHAKIKEEGFLDANYILCKLIVDHAFVYCISDNEYGIEKYFVKKQEKPKADVDVMHLKEIKDLTEPGNLLSMINKFNETYEEKKRIVFGAGKESGLQLYDAAVANDIIKDIRGMQSRCTTIDNSINDVEQASSSKTLTSGLINETEQKCQKRKRFRKDRVLSKIGRGFEDGLNSDDGLNSESNSSDE